MTINLQLIIFLALLVILAAYGYHRGIVRVVISVVSLAILVLVAALIGKGLRSYYDGQILGIAVSVLLLVLIGIAHHLLNVVFFSAKVLSKLPVVHTADQLAGIAGGIVEAVLVFWTFYTFLMMNDYGALSQLVADQIGSSRLLTLVYEQNLLAWLVDRVAVGLGL